MNRPDGLSRKPWWRFGLSILIVGHLWAVIGRPLDFATQGPTGPSPAASTFYAPIRGYSELAYLNHGYAFFAPNPGPSHLIRVEVPRPRGETETYLYPDLDRQWPRLLYHRHFMLTEFLHNTYQPSRMPEEMANDRARTDRWTDDRRRYEAVRGSMRRHLLIAHETDQLEMHRVEHQLAGLPEFLYDGLQLDDPRLYIDLSEDPAAYRPSTLGPPTLGPPALGREPYGPNQGDRGQRRSDSPESPRLPRFGAPPERIGPAEMRGNLPGSGR